MSTKKEIKKLKKLIGKVADTEPSLNGLASLISELDTTQIFNVQPDQTEFMKSLILLAVALGSEERCQEDIDNIYSTDEKRFFHHYNLTGVGKTKVFDRFSIKTSESIKKCFAIIVSEEIGKQPTEVPLFIQRLIKKAYKPAFTFNMHKRWNMLEEFIPWFQEKNGGIEKISGIYLDRCFYVLMYLAYKEKKMVFPTEILSVVNDHFTYLTTEADLDEITNINDDSIAGYEKMLEKITFKDQTTQDVSFVFENIRLIEERAFYDEEFKSLGHIRSMLSRMPLTRITNALLVIMETFGLSGDFLREVKIDNQRLESIAKYIYILKNANEHTERDAEILFLVSLVIYGVAKEYNNVRSGYYEGLKIRVQEKKIEDEKRESLLKEKHQKEITNLQEKLRIANETVSSLKSMNKSKDQTIKELEVEQKRTNMQLEKAKENDKELQFLREFYFNSQVEHKLPDEISIEIVVQHLKSINGVIIGGHTNLTKKLKELLPNFDFVAENETSRNLAFLRNRQIVFISSVHDKHAMYYKVVNEIKNADTVLTYLEKHQNPELLLRDMYEKCLKKLYQHIN